MKNNILIIFILSFMLLSCEDVLDKENLGAINPDDVWNDFNMAKGYVDKTYNALMDGWPNGQGNTSDEGWATNMNDWFTGIADVNERNNWRYDDIRRINIFLGNINSGSIEDGTDKDQLIGQMYFWRAWAYFSMVRDYGGVPLVLDAQDPFGEEDIFVSRNKTSECITQIVADLDEAIAKLPDTWDAANIGRIDKCAALAFKGRVLLYYASPQFNPSGDESRWQAAYQATKEAVDFCVANGKGLYNNFNNLWHDELNKEVVMVRRYNNPESVYNEASIRPLSYAAGSSNGDRPTWDLVSAFPMKDGSAYDPSTGLENYYQNRDDRFYATIGYNGSDLGIVDMANFETYLWTYHTSAGSVENIQEWYTHTSFYRKKALDRTVDKNMTTYASVDWIEIRFAEVLMNFGEAANETGQTDEAMDVLRQIRSRAGIQAGADGNYGIQAADKESIREAYFNERFVEFAFEGKRWYDIRRLRKFDHLNNLKRRHGLLITLKDGETAPSGYDDIDLVKSSFDYLIEDVDLVEDFNLLDKFYFYAIPQSHIDKNSNLEQTKDWENGTFDPLL